MLTEKQIQRRIDQLDYEIGMTQNQEALSRHKIERTALEHVLYDNIECAHENKRTTLLQQGEFVSHSGLTLPFKIDCDALTDEDIECVAEYIASKMDCRFMVYGIPRGGCRLADALKQYEDLQAPFQILIVDDVLTTGASMEKAKTSQPPQVHPSDVVGWVIFARTTPPGWVHAMFTMNEGGN